MAHAGETIYTIRVVADDRKDRRGLWRMTRQTEANVSHGYPAYPSIDFWVWCLKSALFRETPARICSLHTSYLHRNQGLQNLYS